MKLIGHNLGYEYENHAEFFFPQTQGYVEESMEESIQERVAQLETWDLLLVNFPSVFFCLFAGPWSDYNGRKPLLVLPFVGNILSFLAYILNYYFFYELGTSEKSILVISSS